MSAQLSQNPTSVPYTSPETITNASTATPGVPASTVASAAADIWALGVVAFEMFTNERVFHGTPPETIRTALSGDTPLPWEEEDLGEAEESMWLEAEKLPSLKSFVLSCLHRDPAKRKNAGWLEEAWALVVEEHLYYVMHSKASSQVFITCEDGIA